MFVPCRDYCYERFGKQYSPEECDATCDYAKVCLENIVYKAKEEKQKETLEEIRNFFVEANSRCPKHGKVYAISMNDLKEFMRLIKKLAD